MSKAGNLPTVDNLTSEQQAVVHAWGQGVAVLAGAGSGKTTTLVIKCEELVRREPEARFAAVSFTERSASDLRAKLTERLGRLSGSRAGPGGGHRVMTIHGLCATILREYPRAAGLDGEETMLSEPEVAGLWLRATDTLWEDALAPEARAALDRLLARESRDSVRDLLRRGRDLRSFGALERLEQSDDPDAAALTLVVRLAIERYERLKRRRAALDFDDLERGADRALEVAEVREQLQRRFDLVLVDEFQDTNPLQAAIVRRLARPGLVNLCVVGDPKQSIYRFRGADVTVFEDFCRQLPVRLSLTWNFRSRPGIIEYANRVCAPLFEASGMEYQALVPKREAADTGHGSVLRLDVSEPRELAAWIRAEEASGVPLHEMAVLLRKIRGNEKWLKALTAAGIPVALGSGGLFWEDPRVREMVAALRWWDNPGNHLSGAVFLRAPWVGIADARLDEWLRATTGAGGDPQALRRRFLAADHPMARALSPLAKRVIRPGELLMALLEGGSAVEAELGAPLLGLWHRLEEMSARGMDFRSAVAEVSAAIEDARRERDVPPPINQGLLQILTLHGSKGLEFEHVILIDFGANARAPNAPLLFWDRERGAYLGPRDEDGERDAKAPLEAEWRELEKSRALAETKRVFYVALTRARERLVLTCPELPEARPTKTPRKEVDPLTIDAWRGWIEQPGAPEIPRVTAPPKLLAAPVAPAGEAARAEPPVAPRLRKVRPRHSVTEWNRLARCARAYEWTTIRPRAAGEQPADADGGGKDLRRAVDLTLERVAEEDLSPRELGTRVHRCLELGDWAALRALEGEVGPGRVSADTIIGWAESSRIMAPPGPGREVWKELSFEIAVAGEIVVGSIDRLVLDHGRFTLVDFKITGHPRASDALIESYRAQMELYAWAVTRLAPGTRVEDAKDIDVLLVNLSARSIRDIHVPIRGLDVEALARQAARIVDGAAGEPEPGPMCQTCELREDCAPGRQYVAQAGE